MATYYWVGGAGTWDATTTTNWASVSGGSGGAGFPTTADDVIFDTSSGTGTVAFSGVCVCRDLTVTATQALTFGSGTLYGVYGSLSLPVGGSFSWTGVPVTFRATTTGKTLNWGDKTTTQAVGFSGSGGGWSLASAMNVGSLTVSTGTFDTNGYTFTTGGTVTISGTGVLTLGSSTVNAYNFALTSGTPTVNLGTATVNISGPSSSWNANTNLTVTTGASTINLTYTASTTFNGGGKTYYNLNFSGVGYGSYAHSISGANTFNNLSIAATSGTTGTLQLSFQANQVINGTFTTTGTTSSTLIQFISNIAGTQRTLSVGTMGTFTYTKWQDIALTGTASPWTAPTSAYNYGNNSGITFDSTTLYWIGGTGSWNDPAHWSTSSGGSTAGYYASASNNVVFDANSNTGTNAFTVTVAGSNTYCNDFDANVSGSPLFDGKLTLNGGSTGYVYGSVNVPSATYFDSGDGDGTSFTLSATSTGKTIKSGGASLGGLKFNGVGGEWTFQSNITCAQVTISAGSIVTNNYNWVTTNLTASTTNTKTITLGSSTYTSNGGNGWNIDQYTTVNAGTSTINLTLAGAVAFGGSNTYNNVTCYGMVASGSNTFANLTINTPAGTVETFTTFAGNQTVTGTFTVAGTGGNQRASIATDTIGTQRTITAAAVSLTDVDFYGIIGAGAASWSGTRVGNGTLNSGITFTSPKTVYWSLVGGGSFNNSTAWATSSGGTPANVNYPLPQDTAIFDNTGLNNSVTVSTNVQGYYPNIDMSSLTRTGITWQWNSICNICGNITWAPTVTPTGINQLYFLGNTTFTQNGVAPTNRLTVQKGAALNTSGAFACGAYGIAINGTLSLGGNLTSSTDQIQQNGTLTLNNYTATAPFCSFGATSTTNFGTGKISLTGNNTTVFSGNNGQTVTGTPVIECTYSGSTGTRTISAASPTEANTISFNITAGTDTVAITTNVKSLDFTGFSGTLSNGARSIYGNLTVSSGMTLTAGTNATTFAATSGTSNVTTNGKTLDFPLTFNGVGGTWQLQDNLSVGSTRAVTLTGGTFDTNSKTVTSGTFVSSGSSARTLTLGSTVYTLASTGTVWNCATSTNMTINAGSSEILMSSTSTTARTFAGGGLTYNKVTIGGATGTSTTTFSGSNVFGTLASTKVVAHTVSITSGTTQTIGTWSINGTAGNIVTLQSSSTTNHTLTKSGGGTVTADYMSISRSTATPTLTWLATNSTNGVNNVGWYFGAFPKGNTLLFGSNF